MTTTVPADASRMGAGFVPEVRRFDTTRVGAVLRNGTLLFAVASAFVAAGCGIEWQRSGAVVAAVAAELREAHGVETPHVECIKREVFGALWECRAETADGEFDCEVETSPPTKKITALECERRE
jgi:hypothetical protein